MILNCLASSNWKAEEHIINIMNISEKLCLQWNNFQSNASTTFKELRNESDFADVTLVCEENQPIEVHKVILAASSAVFQTMLKVSKHTHPLIYMLGLNSMNLVSLVDFIYYGAVNINQDDLETFLFIAKDLKIKGLENQEYPKELVSSSPLSPLQPMTEKPVSKKTIKPKRTEIYQETVAFDWPIKIEPHASNLVRKNAEEDRKKIHEQVPLLELEEQIKSMMDKTENGFTCNVCGITMPKKHHIVNHVEVKHMKIANPCTLCVNGASFTSRKGLAQHVSNKHK